MDPHAGPHFYMLETHYTNPQLDAFISDSSGLRLLYTERLRTHDAGVLSIGIDPNWRHIIPPGQPEVISEGHCVADCTGQTVPNNGVNMFAVIMHTHQLGKKVRLRQIRAGEELPPIASDTSYNPSYQEYRRLQRPVKVYPVSFLFTSRFSKTEKKLPFFFFQVLVLGKKVVIFFFFLFVQRIFIIFGPIDAALTSSELIRFWKLIGRVVF